MRVFFAGRGGDRVFPVWQADGSTRIQLQVRDVDAAIAAFRKAGATVVSTGGKALDLPTPNGSLKVAIVREPDNLFVVLIQTTTAR